MIASTHTRPTLPPPKVESYPLLKYLARGNSASGPFVVLFTAPGVGTVVSNAVGFTYYKVGTTQTWAESEFEKYYGQVTMENA